MLKFTLISGDHAVVDFVNQALQKIGGCRLTAEYEENASKDFAQLTGPEGEDLGKFPIRDLLPNVRGKMVDYQGGATIVGAQEPEQRRSAQRVHFFVLTGSQEALKALPVCENPTWACRSVLTDGFSASHVELRRDGAKVVRVEVHPIDTLQRRVFTAINDHLAGKTAPPAAESPEPPAPVAYIGTTNNEKLKHGPSTIRGQGWTLTIMFQASAPSDRVIIQTGAATVAEIEVEPIASFSRRLRDSLDADAVGRSTQVAPAKTELSTTKQAQSNEPQGAPDDNHPLWVACRACGEVYQAEYGPPPERPEASQCVCGASRFGRAIEPAEGADHRQVLNPVLVVETTVETKPGAQVTAPTPSGPEDDEYRWIEIRRIGHFLGGNIREDFDDLEEMAASVKEHGIVQPLIVNEIDDQITLIAGERRLRAAGLAGHTKVPCRVRHLTEEEAFDQMMVENLQRKDLSPMEEARGYKRYADRGLTHEQIAKKYSKSRQHISEYLSLNDLPPRAQRMVHRKTIAVKTATTFLTMTKGAPAAAIESILDQFEQQPPSIRGAEEVIGFALRAHGVPVQPRRQETTPQPATAVGPVPGAPTQQTATRAASPTPQPVTAPTAPPQKQQHPTPDLQRTVAPVQATLPTRQLDMKMLGSKRWPFQASETILAGEAYLPAETLVDHLKARYNLGASLMPRALGAAMFEILEDERRQTWGGSLEADGYDGSHILLQKTTLTTLTLTVLNSGHEMLYAGNPIYYRVELDKDSQGRSELRQQLVIQNGGRWVVVVGRASVEMRRATMDAYNDMLKGLPGLPTGVEVLPHAG